MVQRTDVIPLMKSMVIIVTNGVSFSLVAGACCIVYFNNLHNVGSFSDFRYTYTLNINSTGAKSIVFGNSGLKSYDGAGNMMAIKCSIFMYNGTKYYFFPNATYYDYSDG